MYIHGTIVSETTDNPKILADEFSWDELSKMKMVGLPIYVEHIDRNRSDMDYKGVGEILADWMGDDGMKHIIARLYRETTEQILTQKNIKSGIYTGFSLTHLFQCFENTLDGELYQKKTPIEVSICEKGRRANCFILDWTENINDSNIYRLYNTNTDKPFHFTDHLKELRSSLVKASMTENAPENVQVVEEQNMDQNTGDNQTNSMDVEDKGSETHSTQHDVDSMILEMEELRRKVREQEERDNVEKEEEKKNFTKKYEQVKNMINTAFEQIGHPIDDKVDAIWKQKCNGPEGLDFIREALGGIVCANQDNKKHAEELQMELDRVHLENQKYKEQLRKNSHVKKYVKSTLESDGNFGKMDSRFQTKPAVNVPEKLTSDMFYKSKRGVISNVPQGMDVEVGKKETIFASHKSKYNNSQSDNNQSRSQNNNTQGRNMNSNDTNDGSNTPVTYNYSHENKYTDHSTSFSFWQQKGNNFLVKASDKNKVTGNAVEAFSWKNMHAFKMPLSKSGDADPSIYYTSLLNIFETEPRKVAKSN